MSRDIDLSQPLSEEDIAYLAQRDRTPEQEAERQEHAARFAATVAHDQERALAALTFAQRNGGRV